jgi:hypothetical protein
VHEPLARAAPALSEQLTYIHVNAEPSGAPGAYRPIQSVELGEAMPLHVAVTEAPAATIDGLALRVTPPPVPLVVTVNVGLVARRVKPLAAKSRSS